MALVVNHLRGKVLGRAAESVSDGVWLKLDGPGVVGNLDVAAVLDQNGGKSDVSVHDALAVQIPDSHHNLSSEELNYMFRQSFLHLLDFKQ